MKLYLSLSFLLLCFISKAQLPTMTGYLLNTITSGSGGGTGTDIDSTWHTNGYSFENTNNLDSTIIRKGAVAIQLDTILGLGNKLDTGLLIKGKYGTGIGLYNRYVSNLTPNQEIYFGNIFNPYNDTSTAYIRHSQTGNIFEFGQRTPSFVQRYMRLSPGAGVQFQIPNSEKFEITHGSIQKMWFDSTITQNFDDIQLIEGIGHIDTFFTMACVNGHEGKLAYLAIDTIRAYLGISTPSGSNSVLTTKSVTGTGIVGDSIRLVGDLTIPGNNKYYGTNAVGTRGYYDFTLTINNVYDSLLIHPKNNVFISEDFLGTNPNANYGWTTTTNNGNVSLASPTVLDFNHPGICRLSSSGFSGSQTPTFRMDSPRIPVVDGMIYEALVKVEGFGGSNFFQCGLIGGSTTFSNDFIGFEFDGTGNITLRFGKDGTTGTVNTGIAEVDGDWVWVKFIITGSDIEYYINNILIGTTTPSPSAFPDSTTNDNMALTFVESTTTSSIFTSYIDYVSLSFPVNR